MELTVEIDAGSGCCYGVVRAIEEAEKYLEKNSKLYSLGSIVHNSTEMERLKKKGLIVVSHEEMSKLKDSVILIRAHGEPPSSYETAKKNNLTVVDCTCPVVLQLQKRIKEQFEKTQAINGQIIIFGKKGHAEVNGLVGQTDGKAIVVESVSDLDSIDYTRPITIFSQTTKEFEEYSNICSQIKKRIEHAGATKEDFKSFNTICGQVSSRHPHLREFSAKHSVIIFVSGKESSNGAILFNSCKSVNPRSYKIESVDEIDFSWFLEGDSIGVCGATSTPKWLLDEVSGFIRGDMFAKVILPLRYRGEITYMVPIELQKEISKGTLVKVNFSNREYCAVISELSHSHGTFKGELKNILSIIPSFKITENEFKLWEWIAKYYLCTSGEVFKAACPSFSIDKKTRKRNRELTSPEKEHLPELSDAQKTALQSVKQSFADGKVTLLYGVTGSGKSEIYMHLAMEELKKGNSALFLVPEIAMSRQLGTRLERYFGNSLLIYHSKQSLSERERVRKQLYDHNCPFIVLGTRSSLFLPFNNLSLIIVDEEHDPSYKQSDPAPRYSGRDTALILASLHSANTLLGSATPSLESYFNTIIGRYSMVELSERYYGSVNPEIEIIDVVREKKLGRMNGPFSKKMIASIKDTLEEGKQIMVFRNRRSYSPMVQCMYCEDIPICPHCHVSLSYHKSKNELRCHYCNYNIRFNTICTKCGKPGLRERGAGTEKVEETLKGLFPNAKVERFDLETTRSSKKEMSILKNFSQGRTDILVGTQMLGKGFDFENLSLICILNSEGMLAIQDFRAEERTFQMLTQLSGRVGRRDSAGKVIIQTSRPDHPVYNHLLKSQQKEAGIIIAQAMLREREEYGFPPFVRLIRINLRCKNRDKLENAASLIAMKAPTWGAKEWTGPFTPPVEMIMNNYQLQFWVKLAKNSALHEIKSSIASDIDAITKEIHSTVKIIIDVDPY
jgi:primosomal protein N' (replication factor Y)